MDNIRFAVVVDGIVDNVILAPEDFEIDTGVLVASNTAQSGQLWDGSDFTDPALAAVTSEQVNDERDRRMQSGFEFAGRQFQNRTDDQKRIAGASTLALGAMVQGVKPGDLRWADPSEDFVWIAADNSEVPMDALTMFAFGAAAARTEKRLIFAAKSLKSMDPIPADYADDQYWI